MDLSSVCRDNGKTVSLTDAAWEYTKGEFVTCSKWMLEQIATLEEVAGTDLRVLICGGQGTRKQRYAEYLHGLSRRADRPYTRFDCSATHVSQYGRELMGASGRKGIVEQCHGGTLLLDGAGNIPEAYHSAIELLLENGTILRPDGTEVEVDVRLLATTDDNLLSSGSPSRRRSHRDFTPVPPTGGHRAASPLSSVAGEQSLRFYQAYGQQPVPGHSGLSLARQRAGAGKLH